MSHPPPLTAPVVLVEGKRTALALRKLGYRAKAKVALPWRRRQVRTRLRALRRPTLKAFLRGEAARWQRYCPAVCTQHADWLIGASVRARVERQS